MHRHHDPPAAPRTPARPLVDRLLATRGLTRGDLDRALAGDATSPAWPLLDQRYVMRGARLSEERAVGDAFSPALRSRQEPPQRVVRALSVQAQAAE